MSKTVLFIFAGTGLLASEEREALEQAKLCDPELLIIYFNGCHDRNIGGRFGGIGYLSPNLDIVVSGIRDAFNDTNELSLEKLKSKFSNSIIIEPEPADIRKLHKIDKIFLKGYSRGAVTTFAFARKCDDLNIPISLLAVEPIPGNSITYAKYQTSECAKNYDLSGCKNIMKAEIILGTYQNCVNVFHNNFFRQMVPIFNGKTQLSVYAVPIKDHSEFSSESVPHLNAFLEEIGIHQESNYQVKRPYPIPRVLQQKFHIGVQGRKKLSPFYKNKIKEFVIEKAEKLSPSKKPLSINKKMPFITGQALLALSRRYEDLNKIPHALKNQVLNSDIAICDFITETDSIIQFCIEGCSLLPQQEISIKHFFQITDLYIEQLLETQSPSFYQNQCFENSIIKKFLDLKKVLPRVVFNKALKTFKKYIEQNPLTHPHITNFLVKSKPFFAGAPHCNNTFDSESLTVNQLSRKLYLCSEGEKEKFLHVHKEILSEKIKTVHELCQIAWLLPTQSIILFLNKKISNVEIAKVGDLIKLFQHLPKLEHRVAIYKALKLSDFPTPSFVELIQLTSFLPATINNRIIHGFLKNGLEPPSENEIKLSITKHLSIENQVVLKKILIEKARLAKNNVMQTNNCMKSICNILSTSFFSHKKDKYIKTELESKDNLIDEETNPLSLAIE